VIRNDLKLMIPPKLTDVESHLFQRGKVSKCPMGQKWNLNKPLRMREAKQMNDGICLTNPDILSMIASCLC
jgi:hypothetical protein